MAVQQFAAFGLGQYLNAFVRHRDLFSLRCVSSGWQAVRGFRLEFSDPPVMRA
jgi:hypothetical protein